MEPSARRSFHIGRYHCTEALSQGPLGETFRAKVYGVAGLEKQYALKQVDVALRVDPELRQRLVDAARAYSSLEHERIARLTEIHDEAESLFFVMELARGIDLPRLLDHLRGRGESLPVEQAILIAADVAEALEVAQRATEAAPGGVLHLGLVPSAISVLGEGEVRVGDFALYGALERPGWTEDDTLLPVLAYAAPERLRGAPATAASDVWSVGAILYELCANAPLWSGASAVELSASRARLASWDRLGGRPGLRELLERLLSDDPAARPQSASALREALVALLGLEVTRARAGLQGLVKRALGRTMTRTGSFAAVAIPSTSMPTLVQEPPTTPAANVPPPGGPRTIIGAIPPKQVGAIAQTPPPRGWAPPRATGVLGVVRADGAPVGAQTLPGLGEAAPEPPQMEMAELPPSSLSTEITVTEKVMDVVGFDEEGVTSPHGHVPRPEEIAEERIDALEPEALELELDGSDGPTTPGAEPAIKAPPIPLAAAMTAEVTPEPPTVVHDAPSAPLPVQATLLAPLPAQSTVVAPMAAQSTVMAPAPAAPTLPVAEELPTALGLSSIDDGPPAPVSTSRAGVWVGGGFVGLGIAIAVIVLVEKRAATPPVAVPPQPRVEAPKVEAPKVEAPKVEAPKVEAPKVEAPKVEAPKVEAPKVEAPAATPPPTSAGQLVVTTVPAGASIWVDGIDRGPSPLSTPAPTGKHHVLALLRGMKAAQKSVTVEERGASLDLALEPAKLPNELRGDGGLKVRCKTLNELRILVDGHDTGLTCPNAERIALTPGPHTIGLLSPRTGEIKEVGGEIEDDVDHSTRVYTVY